jgi:hypothetical protein
VDTDRLETLSDGVFAITVTLLIVEVRLPPEESGSLAHRLAEAWPGYVAYAISFVTIGIMWANHRGILWQTAAWHHRLIAPGSEVAAAEVTRRYRYGVPTYLAATLAAIWSVPLSLGIDAGLAVLYILPRREVA